jgi:anti-sigma regulatory factor (Ser/Thr protein kinase)
LEVNVAMHGLTVQSRHHIDEESRIGEARRAAQRLAQLHGLDATTAGRVAIAATELATNLVRHSGGGELLMQAVASQGAHVIELISIDRGPGMESVARCLVDGYSTGGTAGNGLGAVRRLASEFDIYSVAGEGTVIMARIGDGPAERFGAISVAVAGESECGDAWRMATEDGVTSAIVIDGLGHGPFAAQAAQCGTAAFAKAPFDPPRNVLERVHTAMAGTRGAAAACARIDSNGAVSYAGIGNISGSLISPQASQGLVSHNGTLGLRMFRMQQFEYQREPKALLVMHSDGISARWDLAARAGLLQRHPAIIAAVLYRDHGRGRDDSTALVVG